MVLNMVKEESSNRWMLYIGIFFMASGIGLPVGIIMVIMYFYNDLKMTFGLKSPFAVDEYDNDVIRNNR